MGISGAGMLPVVDLSELVPTGFQLEFIEPAAVDGNVGLLEMAAISALTKNQKPRAVFEIGTFDGRTTVNLAANVSQETNIYTLNLPPKDVENTGLEIGEWDHKYVSMTQRRPGFEDRRITQLWGDSATFDFSPFRSAIDVVFIDGAHSYDYVMNDSMKALELLRDGVGTILWHDYGTPFCPGVTKALDSLQRKNKRFRNLKHIEGTNLACVLIR